jgi:recombination protein RecT
MMMMICKSFSALQSHKKNTNTMTQETQKSTSLTTTDKAVALFKTQLTEYEGVITDMMKEHQVSPKKFMIYTGNIVKKNPELLDCDRSSLFGAVFAAAELGLLPNTQQNFCDIIPYKRKYKTDTGKWEHRKEAQFQLGYLGIIELLYRNPEIIDLDTQIVFTEDHFEEVLGSDRKLIHGPGIEGKRGEPMGVYAIAALRSGAKKWKYLSKAKIMEFKNMSQGASSDYSPWNAKNDPELWMWRKTAIKQLWKELPKIGTLGKAIDIDNATEMGGNLHATEDGDYEIIDGPEVTKRKAEFANDKKEERAKQVQGSMFHANPTPGQ